MNNEELSKLIGNFYEVWKDKIGDFILNDFESKKILDKIDSVFYSNEQIIKKANDYLNQIRKV